MWLHGFLFYADYGTKTANYMSLVDYRFWFVIVSR
jgi:hypothetical protein